MNEFSIELVQLQKSYHRPVLRDVNLSIDNSSFVAILGKSGSGKSTLLNILGLLERFDAGTYRFNGMPIRNDTDYHALRLNNIGFIFQSYNLIPTLTCRENILLPTLYGYAGSRDLHRLASLLDIKPLLDQNVTTLSGGEKQRVAIARALILDPCLLLADEPTGNLDPKNREIIFRLLENEHKKGRGIVLITHDSEAALRAETTLLLHEGRLIPNESAPVQQ